VLNLEIPAINRKRSYTAMYKPYKSEFHIRFGKHLKETIKSRGYKISQFAKLSNITYSALYHYIKGHSEPNVKTLIRMCRVLQVSVDDILLFEKKDG
jgi:predicted transcriptional regulator